MKIILFNDTSLDWRLHTASWRGVGGENRIPAHDDVVFEVPEDYDVFVKVWDGMAMVQTGQEQFLDALVTRSRVEEP